MKSIVQTLPLNKQRVIGGNYKNNIFTKFEREYHKDIVVISMIASLFVVSDEVAENKFEGVRVVESQPIDEQLNTSFEETKKFYVDGYKFLVNGCNKSELESISSLKDKVYPIYMEAFKEEKYHKNFSLEVFALNLLIVRFIESGRRKKIAKNLTNFISKENLEIISNVAYKSFEDNSFLNEYEVATKICEDLKSIK